MKLNKNAFTLIELLVTIAIIAIVSTIAVVSIMSVVNSAKDDTQVISESELKKAVELYTIQNRNEIKQQIKSSGTNSTKITEEDLINSKYIEGNVSVDKNSNSIYSWGVTLNNQGQLELDKNATVTYPKFSDLIKKNNPVNETTPNFGAVATTDEGLFKATDFDGDTYYFRGAVEDNYVSFAGFTWRIVRINGDESIRLILNDTLPDEINFNPDANDDKDGIEEKHLGYTYDNSRKCIGGELSSLCNGSEGTSSIVKQYVDNWFSSNLSSYYDDYLTSTRFCNDTSIYSISTTKKYNVHKRLYTDDSPIFTCPSTEQTYGGEYNLNIGLLSADEATFAGNVITLESSNNYLIRNNSYLLSSPYTYTNKIISRIKMTNVKLHTGASRCSAGNCNIIMSAHVSPVINIKADVLSNKGNGTKKSPYELIPANS